MTDPTKRFRLIGAINAFVLLAAFWLSSPASGASSGWETSYEDGQNFDDRNRADKAITSYKQALQTLPPDQAQKKIEIESRLVLTLNHAGKFSEAQPYAKDVIEFCNRMVSDVSAETTSISRLPAIIISSFKTKGKGTVDKSTDSAANIRAALTADFVPVIWVQYSGDLQTVLDENLPELERAKHVCTKTVLPDGSIKVTDSTIHHSYLFKAKKKGKSTDDYHSLFIYHKWYPNNSDFTAELAKSELKLGHLKSAELFAKEASRSEPVPSLLTPSQTAERKHREDALKQARVGYAYCQAGDFSNGIATLTLVIKNNPNFINAYKNRAEAYAKIGKLKESQADLDRIRTLQQNGKGINSLVDPHDLIFRVMRRDALDHDFEVVIALAGGCIKREPDYYVAYHFRALNLAKKGDYDAAMSDIQRLKTAFPKNSLVLKADQHVSHLKMIGAPKYGDISCITKDEFFGVPDGDVTQFDLNPPIIDYQTFETIRTLAKRHTGDYRVYLAVAQSLADQGKFEPAYVEYNKAKLIWAEDSQRRPLILDLLRHCQSNGDWQKALNLSNDYLENLNYVGDYPVLDSVLFAIQCKAQASEKLGKISDAVAAYNKILEAEPDSAETFRDLADCYQESKNYREAIKNYTKAIEHDPDKTPQNYLHRAAAYDKSGNKELAAKDREMAKKYSGNSPRSGKKA